MDFRILGPLDVAEGDARLDIPGGKERSLLAILLLHANETVSRDRLIDDLWGGSPPTTAAKSIQVYISRLRRALGGNGVLVTRGQGYELCVGPGELDLERFEALSAEGARALSEGAAAEATGKLHEALALWRGPPLSDFAYERFAQVEIARLEEMRFTALEQRLAAEVELGRHVAAVPELEALVAGHPLRERLWEQLMLALYRGGRRADALDAYRRARAVFVEELGLEPGEGLRRLEQAILAEDPALVATADAGPPGEVLAVPVFRRRRRTRTLVAVGLLLLAAAVAAAVGELGGSSSSGPTLAVGGDSVAALDPATNRLTEVVSLANAEQLAASGRSVWAESDASRTVTRIDATGRQASPPVPVGVFPSAIAAGEGSVWVVDGSTGKVVEVDPTYAAVVRTVRFRPASAAAHSSRDRLGPDPTKVAAGAGGVWIVDGSQRLVEIDPRSGRIAKTVQTAHGLDSVAVGGGSVWVTSGDPALVLRVDPGSGRIVAAIPIATRSGSESPFPTAVAVGSGFVWTLNGNTNDVTKVDPGAGRVVATIPVGSDHGPFELTTGGGAAWTANGDGTVSRIDPTGATAKTIAIPRTAQVSIEDVAVAGGLLWLSDAAQGG